ncbi:MAG: tetratricopeptide repeat protein [Candidatus Binatia bacterium]
MICAYRFAYLLLVLSCTVFAVGCWRPAGFGIGGRYLDARLEISNPGGNLNLAITNLEYVVRRDPFYKDSLTLLGRAYYKGGRYRDAFQILKRALAINPQDEIAWIALGLTQLSLGDDQRGLETFKGGISLLLRVSRDGYKDIEFWDKSGLVRSAARRAVLFASKGLGEKQKIIRMGEILLFRIDNELWEGRREQELDEKQVD